MDGCLDDGWLVGWLVGWLLGRLVNWLVRWLAGQLVGRSVGQVGRLSGWLAGFIYELGRQLAKCCWDVCVCVRRLVCVLGSWMVKLSVRPATWLNWLAGRLSPTRT